MFLITIASRLHAPFAGSGREAPAPVGSPFAIAQAIGAGRLPLKFASTRVEPAAANQSVFR
jgi:hypothetical protein